MKTSHPLLDSDFDLPYGDILNQALQGKTIIPAEAIAASFDNGDFLRLARPWSKETLRAFWAKIDRKEK